VLVVAIVAVFGVNLGDALSPVFAQPIVANGTVYWESFDGYERATSTSGALVWKTFLGTTTPQAGTLHSAVGWQEMEVSDV